MNPYVIGNLSLLQASDLRSVTTENCITKNRSNLLVVSCGIEAVSAINSAQDSDQNNKYDENVREFFYLHQVKKRHKNSREKHFNSSLKSAGCPFVDFNLAHTEDQC